MVFDPSQEIEHIYISAELDLSKAENKLKDFQSSQQVFKLKAVVDDKQLTSLNRHLDLKQTHLKQTIDFYRSNPLRVYTDQRQLTDLNRSLSDLKSLSNQKIAFQFDDREIVQGLKNIQKQLQANNFRLNFDRNNFTTQIQQALNKVSPNLAVNIKVKESVSARTESKELTIGLKNIERAVYKTSAKRGVVGSVLTGASEALGGNLLTQINKGIRDVFGKEIGQQARKTTRGIAKFTKSTFIDNDELKQASQEVDAILGERLRKTGYKLGDAVVAGLEDQGGNLTSKLNAFIKNATENVDFSKVGQEFYEELTVARKKVVAAIASEQALIKITEPISQKITAYRETALKERAVPLVRQRALEILNTTKGKSDQLSTKAVNDQTENLIIGIGGYAGAKGLSGKTLVSGYARNAPGLNELNKQNPNNAVIWVRNSDSDIPKESMGRAQDKLIALLTSLGKPNLRGYSKDALEIAAQAIAAREKNPNINIKIVGESGGGFGAEEAKKLLDLVGIKSEYLAVGTPNFIGGLDNGKNKIISPDEILGNETSKLYARLGLARRSRNQSILGVTGHPYENYRNANVAELQNFLQGSPGELKPEMINDFKTGVDYFKKQTANKNNLNPKQIDQLSRAAYDNLQYIRRYLLEATGDTEKELQVIVKEFENVFVDLEPDDRDFAESRKALNKAKTYLEYLEKQPGIEAAIVANDIAKELELLQKQVKSTFDKTTPGSTQNRKYQSILSDVTSTKNALLNPAIGVKQPIVQQATLQIKTVEADNLEIKQAEIQKTHLLSVDEAVSQSKNITSSFSDTYKSIKTDLKAGNIDYVDQNNIGANAKAAQLLQLVAQARQDINKLRDQAGIPKIGTTEASKINQTLGTLSTLEKNLQTSFKKAKLPLPEIKKLGEQINQGLEIGIKNTENLPTQAIEQVAEQVIEQAQEIFEIKSPSRVFQEIGEFIGQGLKLGLDSISTSDLFKTFRDGITEFFDGIGININDLLLSAGKLGLGFAGIVTALPLVKDFIGSSLQVATEMENLNRQIVFASGNSQAGQESLQIIKQNAKDLKIDTRQALQGASGFLASTQNSSLEGLQSVEILSNFNTLLATRSVDRDRQQRFNVALEQMASKGIQSEELRGQASEAVPGFYQIFARSQGLSTAELAKKLKNTPGGLSPESLIAASQQARAESIVALPDALNTSQAAINKLDNSVLALQEKVGNIFLPIQKISFNVASGGLEFISDHLDLISRSAVLLGIYLSRPLWKPFIEGALLAVKNIDLLTLKSKAASVDIGGIATALKPIAAELLIFQTVLTAVDLLRISFTNLGGAATDFANQSEKGLKAVQKSFEQVNKTPGKTNQPYTYGIQQYLGDVFENPLALINPFDNSKREKDKSVRDTLNSTKRGYESGKQLLAVTDSSETLNSIKQITEYDKQLATVQSRRRALIQLNPEDKKGVQDLTKLESELVKARYESLKPLGAIQGQIEAQIRGLKNVKPLLESFNKDGRYDKDLDKIDEQIKQLEEKQNSLTKAVGKTTSAFDYWKKSIQESNILLLDTKSNIEQISTEFKNTVSTLNLSGNLTPGNQQFSNSLIDVNSLTKQQQAQANNVNQNSALFGNGTDAQNVLKSYKINQNTGINRINQIISQTDNDNDKFILEQFASYQQSKIDLKNLSLQVTEAKNNLFNSLKENTKAVAEYYQGIQRETLKVSVEMRDGLNQLNTLTQQNKIKSALTNVGDNIFTQFADSIVQNLQEMNDIRTGKNSIISKTQQAQFDIEDIVKQGVELSRSVPGNLPKIPVELNLENINNEQNVQLLNSSLTETNDLTALINQGNNELNKILIDSNNSVNGINSSFNQSVSQTNQFNSALDQTKTQATDINSIFNNIVNAVQNAASNAVQLVGTLATGNIGQLLTPGNINNAGNLIDKGLNFLKGQDITTKPYKIQESVGGRIENVKSYYDLEKHHPSAGIENGREYTNMLYADINRSKLEEIRKAGDRILVKKDFILSQGGNQNVPVPSPVNGYAKTSNSFGTVNIYQDANFKTLIAKVLHLADFAVKSGDYVKYGQSLGTQGGKGANGQQGAYGVHAHVETDVQTFKTYINDLITGKFTTETTNAINFVQQKFNNSSSGLSANLLNFVKKTEGFKSTPYSDHGQLSIGYGTRARSGNEVINESQASQRLADELLKAQQHVLSTVKVKLEPNQLDALTSLAYNTGNIKQFPKLLSALNTGNFAEAQKQFLDINKASGRPLDGLTTRRQREAAMFGANPAMQASLNGQFLTPGNLQSTISGGIGQAVNNKQVLNQIDIAQTQRQNEIKANDLLRKNENVLRTLRRGLRDSADSSRTDKEQLQDLRANVNPIKDTFDNKALEIVKQQREFDGYIRDRERKLIDIDDKIKTANQLLQSGGLNDSQRKEIQIGLSQSVAEKAQAQKELTELKILKNDTIETAKNVFGQQENFRNSKIVFDQTSLEITNLQNRVESLKALQTFNPLDQQVQQIPDLEKLISLKQIDLETEKNILDVQEKVFNKSLTKQQGDQQIENLKKASILKQEQIDLTYQESKAQQELQNLSREFNIIQKERANTNDRIKEQLTAIELIQRRNPGDYSRGNGLELTNQSQLLDNKTNYENKKIDIFGDKTITDKNGAILRNALLNNSRVRNINETYQSDLEQQRIKDIQNSNDRQNTVTDFINTPTINLLNSRASSITANSGNEFKANALSRQAALLQENIRYQRELNDLDAQVAQMNFQGLDTSGLEQVKNSLQDIHKLNLENVNIQFKTFGQTIESIGRQSLMGLSQSLTDLIIKGGSLGDVFDNLFNTVLSGVLNAGIGSLLGGLFYDGGIVPNFAMGGSIVKGLKKEKAESGRKPMLAIVHQGELLIPGDRVAELTNNGLTPEMLLGNFARGGVIGSTKPTANMVNDSKASVSVSYESTVINQQEYVSKDQFEQGLRRAAEAGAKGGEQRITSKLSNSVNYRKSLGIGS